MHDTIVDCCYWLTMMANLENFVVVRMKKVGTYFVSIISYSNTGLIRSMVLEIIPSGIFVNTFHFMLDVSTGPP